MPAEIAAPRGRWPLATGIVHFGPGAFHRAHQAAFIDRLLDDDPRWGIAAVSLRTRATVEALAEQDGLYTLAVRDRTPELRVIGAHTAFLGPEDAAAVRALLADPAVTLVTSTVTEKGYCLTPDGELDLEPSRHRARPGRPGRAAQPGRLAGRGPGRAPRREAGAVRADALRQSGR